MSQTLHRVLAVMRVCHAARGRWIDVKLHSRSAGCAHSSCVWALDKSAIDSTDAMHQIDNDVMFLQLQRDTYRWRLHNIIA